MAGQWRRNEKDNRSTPLDPNALKLQNLAKSASTLERDCLAILPRINWTRLDAANRARELIGEKFQQFLQTIVIVARDFDASHERVYRNLITWSPSWTLGALLAVARWDARQTQPVLEGFPLNALKGLEPKYPYWLMEETGPIIASELEALLPNHPIVILRAYFYEINGPVRRKQISLVRDIFKFADRLNWWPSKKNTVEAIQDIFDEHKVVSHFTKPIYFALSERLQAEINKHYTAFPNLIPEREIVLIREELLRRENAAKERYKRTATYLASVVAKGDFENPEVLSLIENTKTSKFHEKAFLRGISECIKPKCASVSTVASILNLPNSDPFLALKFLFCELGTVLASMIEGETKNFRAFRYLSNGSQTKVLKQFNLRKKTMPQELTDAASEFATYLIKRQLLNGDERIKKLGVSNALIAAERYAVDMESCVRSIIAGENGITAMLDGPRSLEALISKFSISLQNSVIRKIRSYRSKNKNDWGK